MTPTNPYTTKLERLQRAIKLINTQFPHLQAPGHMLALIAAARAEARDELFTVQDMLSQLTLEKTHASRLLATLCYHYKLISLHEHPRDRRHKSIRLTTTGRKFLDSVLSEMR